MQIEKQPRELKHPSHRKWYEKQKAQHRCVMCGATDSETLAGRVRCASCREIQNQKNAAYRARRPHKEKPRPLTKEERKASIRRSQQALRACRKAEHRCRECGQQDNDTLNGYALCGACREYRRRLRRIRNKEGKE